MDQAITRIKREDIIHEGHITNLIKNMSFN